MVHGPLAAMGGPTRTLSAEAELPLAAVLRVDDLVIGQVHALIACEGVSPWRLAQHDQVRSLLLLPCVQLSQL